MEDVDGLPNGATKLALIDTLLMVEWLSEARPSPDDAVWVGNIPAGPDPRGIAALQSFQRHYGSCHVTTGNPQPREGQMGNVGVYIREDVLEPNENFLQAYLSR